MSDHSTILTAAQVCDRLTISEPTLRRYTKGEPGFPRKIRLGRRRIGFLKADVEAYVASRYEQAGSAASA